MRTLFYTQTGLTSKQIGLCGEVLESVLIDNHDVRVVRCNAVLNNCYFNRAHNILACASCQSREEKILNQTPLKKENIIQLKCEKNSLEISLPQFENIEELQKFSFNEINLGRGVASSLISHTRDFDISSKKHDLLISTELRKAINVTLNFKKIISEFRPEQIYLFNGRFSEVFPLLELAKKYQIPFFCIEAGAGHNYHLFKNCLPHSIIGRTNIMNEIWNKTDELKRNSLASNYFTSKRKGSESFEKSYTKAQAKNKLPEGFDPSKMNVAIFNSSEDEVKTIDEWQHDLYETQNDAINTICKRLESNNKIHFYLRVHPNLFTVKNRQVSEIAEMNFKNLTIIPASSDISSYALMEACNKVITFGSTMGIEATFGNKVSILYGKSYYMNTEACYQPQSYDQLVTLIADETLLPKPKETTYPYGLFLTQYGQRAKYFHFDGLANSKYKGQKIKKSYFTTIGYLFRYLKYFESWKTLHKAYFGSFNILTSPFKYK